MWPRMQARSQKQLWQAKVDYVKQIKTNWKQSHWTAPTLYQHRCTRRMRRAVVNRSPLYPVSLTQCNSSQPAEWSKPFSTLYSSASPTNWNEETKKKTNHPDKKLWRQESNEGIITELLNNIHKDLSDVIQPSTKLGRLWTGKKKKQSWLQRRFFLWEG